MTARSALSASARALGATAAAVALACVVAGAPLARAAADGAGGGEASWRDVAAQLSADGTTLRYGGALYTQAHAPPATSLQQQQQDRHTDLGDDGLDKPLSETFWVDVAISTGLVCTAGTVAGLTMGFVSLDPTYLEILKRTGTPEQKEQARKVAPLVNQHHLVLVTLLLANSAANEALPIFLNRVVNEYLAILISVTAVLVRCAAADSRYCCAQCCDVVLRMHACHLSLLMPAAKTLAQPTLTLQAQP